MGVDAAPDLTGNRKMDNEPGLELGLEETQLEPEAGPGRPSGCRRVGSGQESGH